MTEKKRILSGMRPTGRLHLGNLHGALENWIQLQKQYDCFFFVADWHALTTDYATPGDIHGNIWDMVLDWLSAGLDPKYCTLFIQSEVKEHAELHLLLSMITPLSWLERVPTYKDQIRQFRDQGKDIGTYGFLGYPLLMAADILMYRPFGVPVGEDQLPHLEFCRELSRRFYALYGAEVFTEPKALLAQISMLPGIDKRKMSKSYNNFINLSADEKEVKDKIKQMITDPERIRKTDPGHPDICCVHTYHGFYNKQQQAEISENCRCGAIGCGECKNCLSAKINEFLAPVRERRAALEAKPHLVDDVIEAGNTAARRVAVETMVMVREAMKI